MQRLLNSDEEMGTTASSNSCRKAVREKTLPLRNKKPLFWMSLIGYSLEYIQYLGLINPDIENLCEDAGNGALKTAGKSQSACNITRELYDVPGICRTMCPA